MIKRLSLLLRKYRTYAMALAFFAMIFVIWGLGVWWGFSSLGSVLAGILFFLVASALYLLLLYRGVDRQDEVESALIQSADDAVLGASPEDREEVSLLRERLLEALERMKKGDGGKGRKRDLLYRLPWYLVIGQPAVGKSTLVYRSGLDFPFADREHARIAGVGGTRHCDWFFSSEAVLLDSAGRYTASEEDASRWRAFLGLLRQHRPRRPLNGLIVAVSIDELIGRPAPERESLVLRLRERLQETYDQLGTVVPIYLVFTKSDLIPGFRQFHRQLAPTERDEVLGWTFAHQDFETANWAGRFGEAVDGLVKRCRTIGEQRLVEGDMIHTRDDPAALEFPLELRALAPLLSSFAGSLLKANPYQSSPLLRGFYFTSALADGQPAMGEHARAVESRFGLAASRGVTAPQDGKSLFVTGLFSQVILPDQYLVGLYSGPNRERRRQLRWCWVALALAAVMVSGWALSFSRNADELAAIDTSLAEARVADGQHLDGYTRWEALDALRVGVAHYVERDEQGAPWPLGMGLYHGDDISPALRKAYFDEIERSMLRPVADNLGQALYTLPTIPVYRSGESERITAIDLPNVEPNARPADNSPQALADFGNAALGTYVELSRTPRPKVSEALLRQRLPDYWYPAISAHDTGERDPRDLDFASRQIAFYARQIQAPDVPRIDDNSFLISSSRNYIDGLLDHSLRTLETITLESDTLFSFGRADFAGLQAAGQQQLNRIAERLVNTPGIGRITITGHADQIGSAQTNKRLSLERAQTVRTYLIGKGVTPEMVEAVGAGSERPLVQCESQLGRSERIRCLAPNRRVEIAVRASS